MSPFVISPAALHPVRVPLHVTRRSGIILVEYPPLLLLVLSLKQLLEGEDESDESSSI